MGDVVITTIQQPTTSVLAMVEKARRDGLRVIAVGDRKTPDVTWPKGVEFLSIASQLEMDLKLPALLPENHYARKNLGYLLVMSRGAEVIFDTDDDNAPLQPWRRREVEILARPCSQTGWVNAYQWFTDEHIWPRGLPLEFVRSSEPTVQPGQAVTVRAPIQQGLANGSPDVDAVWRLTLDKDIAFQDNGSVLLGKGAWCPFNSQSTWWFPEAYPLMYLPSFVSFRMTDIWRSFIAQRCLWSMGYGLVFHGPEMYQERNPHNLLRDFEQEIPGYLGNDKICQLLEKLNLSGKPEDAGSNLHFCYEALIKNGFVPVDEMALVEAWLNDVSACVADGGNQTGRMV
jgi:hypothetical protein